jgi:hypothetical protein
MGKLKVNVKVRIRHHEKPEYIGKIGIIADRGGRLGVYPGLRDPNKPPLLKTAWLVKVDGVEELVLCKEEELEKDDEKQDKGIPK